MSGANKGGAAVSKGKPTVLFLAASSRAVNSP